MTGENPPPKLVTILRDYLIEHGHVTLVPGHSKHYGNIFDCALGRCHLLTGKKGTIVLCVEQEVSDEEINLVAVAGFWPEHPDMLDELIEAVTTPE